MPLWQQWLERKVSNLIRWTLLAVNSVSVSRASWVGSCPSPPGVPFWLTQQMRRSGRILAVVATPASDQLPASYRKRFPCQLQEHLSRLLPSEYLPRSGSGACRELPSVCPCPTVPVVRGLSLRPGNLVRPSHQVAGVLGHAHRFGRPGEVRPRLHELGVMHPPTAHISLRTG